MVKPKYPIHHPHQQHQSTKGVCPKHNNLTWTSKNVPKCNKLWSKQTKF